MLGRPGSSKLPDRLASTEDAPSGGDPCEYLLQELKVPMQCFVVSIQSLKRKQHSWAELYGVVSVRGGGFKGGCWRWDVSQPSASTLNAAAFDLALILPNLGSQPATERWRKCDVFGPQLVDGESSCNLLGLGD